MIDKDIIVNSRVLIVDDQPANVLLLERVLQQAGYQHYQSTTDSREALEQFRIFQPDLLVLDLMMPKLDGYSVMGQLRGWIPAEEYFPILVITADISRAAKQKALTLGAKDFLTKPVDNMEAALRIYNLLETRRLHRRIQAQNRQLVEQNERLDETVQVRSRELTDAHQRLSLLDRAKTDFLRMISHELRTPLNGLLGTSELLLDELGSSCDEELREMLQQSRRRILALADQALLLTQLDMEPQKFMAGPTSLRDVWVRAITAAAELARAEDVALPLIPETDHFIAGDRNLLTTAFQSLLETAVRFSKPGDAVALMVEGSEGSVTAMLRTRQGTLSDSALAQFFDLFTLTEASTAAGHLGLGPRLAQRILSLFGATLSVANCVPSGIEWRIVCPALCALAGTAQTQAASG